jgi:two-component system KDP operon response regulator KdpE
MMKTVTHVLIVDDEQRIRKLVRANLEQRGFKVNEAVDGTSAISSIRQLNPDLILLDIKMPDMSGLDVCRWVRQFDPNTPIIVLSAQSQEEQKVEALNIGADDYITKPFGHNELVARVKAVMRRVGDSSADERKVEIDGFMIDMGSKRCFVNGSDIRLTRTEYALLAELAKNLDAVITHDELLVKVWGPEYRGSNHYLHVYLGRVRKKMLEYNGLLETIPGIGYILHSKRDAKK